MSDLEEIFDELKRSPLSQIAWPLGYLSIIWAWLEKAVDASLFMLMDYDWEKDGEKEFACVAYNMDFRAKLASLKALSFHKKLDDAWFGELDELINRIDNDLRPARNRMVHDTWLAGSEKIMRFSTYAKVVNEQARKLALKFGHGAEVKDSDVMVLNVKILAALGKLLELSGRYSNAVKKPQEKVTAPSGS